MAAPSANQSQSPPPKRKWVSPSLQLKWGAYFKTDPADEKAIVDAAVASKGAGLITTRMAAEKLAPIYNVENVDAVLEDIEGEKAENDARELEKTEAEATALHKAAAVGVKAGGTGSVKKPRSASGGGKGSAKPSK